tara:strand:+ start:564 stop:758 length:195 start_codon:yes stop_codon:yes gene_type:complete
MLAAVAAAEALVDRVRLEEMVAEAQAEMGEEMELVLLVLLVQLTQEAVAAVVILVQEELAVQVL